ncbi:uncharacterized protein LOC143294324 [Babylonia areolata]|uniref:uncharacterized protein LOC143294324 n=1 Tax=Babylonia areolata TaxID=304850 RepID=UPI003FD0E065
MMTDPVVSSKYGKRPLLDMPALHVDSDTRLEISSLQPRVRPPEFGSMPSMIYSPEGIGQVNPQPLTAPAALPSMPQGLAPSGGNFYAPQPAAPAMYPQPAYHHPPSMVPQMMGGPSIPTMQPQPMYPAMQPPYQAPGYYHGAAGAPGGGVVPIVPPPRTPIPHNFHVEGVLQYGQLTTIHFRDKTNDFRGIPEYLRQELLKTYGRYPVTDIRIVAINGQFHIYASPRKGEDSDEFVEYDDGPGTPHNRLVGFNEVRGQPRDLLQRNNRVQY